MLRSRGGASAGRTLSHVDADAVELRVLGCLLEKQRTTPDTYPLSLNALRLACNQATNRDPVVAYEEREIHEALQRLARRGWTRLASGAGSRAAKYRQLFDEALGLDAAETAVLCVLMLRGPQTPGELNQRTQRLHPFAGLDDVHATLDALVEPRPRRAAGAPAGPEGGPLPPPPERCRRRDGRRGRALRGGGAGNRPRGAGRRARARGRRPARRARRTRARRPGRVLHTRRVTSSGSSPSTVTR